MACLGCCVFWFDIGAFVVLLLDVCCVRLVIVFDFLFGGVGLLWCVFFVVIRLFYLIGCWVG